MDIQFETYDSRIISEDEYVFWHQALNRRSDIVHYNWSRVPQEAKQFVDSVFSSYDELWVESNWKNGNDPALFGKKNNQTYLLARWGTDEIFLRKEDQIMLSYQRQVESEAFKNNGMFQVWFFIFEAICTAGGATVLIKNGLGYIGMALLMIGLLLEIGRRLHKNRGLTRPVNVWERQALEFVKNQPVRCA